MTQCGSDILPQLSVHPPAAHLHIRVEAGVAQTLPVQPRLKAQLVHAGSELLPGDESWAAAVLVSGPE